MAPGDHLVSATAVQDSGYSSILSFPCRVETGGRIGLQHDAIRVLGGVGGERIIAVQVDRLHDGRRCEKPAVEVLVLDALDFDRDASARCLELGGDAVHPRLALVGGVVVPHRHGDGVGIRTSRRRGCRSNDEQCDTGVRGDDRARSFLVIVLCT
jgi:hypothetical protein